LSTPESAASAPEIAGFDEPWQAQIFAMTTLLSEGGAFTWSEWTLALGAELKAGPQDSGNDVYFEGWLRALEKLLVAKGITDAAALSDLTGDWLAAAAHTPHGQPVLLGAHDHET
jgi:nitrile hydratase accessory protein